MPPLGHIDIFTSEEISGWAWDPERPERTVTVAIEEQGVQLLTIAADQLREDLRDAGIGTGRYGFRLRDLDRLFPAGRHEVRVQRLPDGADLSGSPSVVVATGGPHLTLDARLGGWVVCFGRRAWRLTWPGAVLELAHFLPMNIRDADDDLPAIVGEAQRREDAEGPHLALADPAESEPYRLPLCAEQIAPFSILWARGAMPGENWRRAEAALEVENVRGVRLAYALPRRGEAGDKRLTVAAAAESEQVFTLKRGERGTIEFRTASRDRHRVTLTMDPEPGNQRRMGFILTGLDVIAGSA